MSETPKLYRRDPEADFDYYDDYVEASPADLIAVVRRGVESGTIKGEVIWRCAASPSRSIPCDRRHGWEERDNPECKWVLVIPVSDGGSET